MIMALKWKSLDMNRNFEIICLCSQQLIGKQSKVVVCVIFFDIIYDSKEGENIV